MKSIKFQFLISSFIYLILVQNCCAQKPILGSEKFGLCSFYANKFDGLFTSNGEKYSKDEYTAAHKTLPFNTILAVFNVKTNKYVIVRVNDRGPHRKTRMIDLSGAAARELGILKIGITKVKIRILGFQNFQNLEPIDPEGNEADLRNK